MRLGIDDLKERARILHRSVRQRDEAARSRLRFLKEPRDPGDPDLDSVRRRHCLAVVSRELGFRGWSHLCAVVRGEESRDFGTLLCPGTGSAFWNIWCDDYDEARAIRAEHGGYLLTFLEQFLIVERPYIEWLGLDPDDPDWERIGRDWARPGDIAARTRLYEKLFGRFAVAT